MVDTRWVVKCVPTESGIGFGQDKLYFKAPDFRTCGGDLWGVSVFPPGTDERELRGGHGMGLGRALNRATNQHSGGTTTVTLGTAARVRPRGTESRPLLILAPRTQV